ncbi:glycosyltransferase [Methanosphaerula subterraneus]|uniref:glycosyltransferase n=1 Tax=Methanosphaerula subterraneus TaxID=3350244 RepID=UPI003F8247C7
MKFALVSIALPPAWGGQAVVLYHLLKEMNPDEYCLITQKNYHFYSMHGECAPKLRAHYHFLSPDYQVNRRAIIGAAGALHLKAVLEWFLSFRTRQIVKIVRKEACDAIVACTGDIFDPPAAYRASRILGIPFYLYAFDKYSQADKSAEVYSFTEKYEPELLRGATGVIVPNEFMFNDYLDRYDITATIIHNPSDLPDITDREKKSQPEGEKKIVYTGAIYAAHFDAFRDLIEAIRSLNRDDIKVHLYTTQSQANLEAEGIRGPVVYHKHQPLSVISEVQQRADVLFLPLAFNSAYPEVIRTSAPGKTGDYLASGRPILVHAPADSFVSWYFKEHECGIVVDQKDPAALASALYAILSDKDVQARLGEAARSCALKDFNPERAREVFSELIQSRGRT